MASSQPLSYTLPSRMTAETAESVAEALAQLPMGDKPSVTIDASAVESFSASGAQILAALEKSVQAAEGELEITGQKTLLSQAFHEMGLGWLVNSLR